MKFILTIWACILSVSMHAQVNRVTIQASGLTCSMCSNAINKSLKSLDIVSDVKANIKESSFEISFKSNGKVDFDALKKKVEDAGFFVAKMEVKMQVPPTFIKDDAHLNWEETMYHFLHVGDKKVEGEITLQILDKGFVPAKTYKRNAKYTAMECYKTGVMGPCCKDKKTNGTTRIYHVTI